MKLSQLISFSVEVARLSREETIQSDSRILPLSPFLDLDNIFRVESRISYFTHLHLSNKPILLKRIVSNCTICKFLEAFSTSYVSLPRSSSSLPYETFTHCGLDYFGPFRVKIGRRIEKRWGVLFTCMSIKAIHMEIANSLTTDSAIMSLRRFAGRPGTPAIIYSDNGKNLKGMNRELSAALRSLDHSAVNGKAAKLKIRLKFNPPTASHMGGAWEKLIRSVKTALTWVLKNRNLKEEVLHTFSVEIEYSVSSRPLTHVSCDARDSEALTPNHFLLGSSSGQLYLPRYDQTSIIIREQALLWTYSGIVGYASICRHYTLERNGINVEIRFD